MSRRLRAGASTAAVTIAALLAAVPAAADTFKPTRLDDPPPGKCKPGDCSLREAIRAANDRNGDDRVALGTGTYRMQIGDDLGLGIESGDFNLAGPLVVRGRGSDATKVDAKGVDRVFTAGVGKVTLQGLTIKGGDSGANAGHTSLGGGLTAIGGEVVVRDVAIRGNAAQYGGGISSIASQLVVRGSTISGNDAGEGGGLDLRGDDVLPVTTIRSSTISGNTAGKGGGILADGNPPTGGDPPEEPLVEVLNSTVAKNLASAEAGGVMADNGASVTLDFTTVTDNAADSDDVGGGDAGGIYQHAGADFDLTNSILARNEVGASGQGPQCGGTIGAHHVAVQGQGGNVCTFSVQTYFTYDPNDPRLGTLAHNGGPTRTVKLLTMNGAIGLAVDCPSRDQRGRPRPDEDCDAGAFERAGP